MTADPISEALRHADIDLSLILPLIENEEIRASVRATLKMIDAARARLLWRPIDSDTPRDGTPIIGWSDEGVSYVCWWSRGNWTFFKSWRGDEWQFEPTKWMPHPAFPEKEAIDG